MRDIELRLEPSFEARYKLLTRLPDLPAKTLQGVCLKLAVATKAIPEDENPEAHALLQSTLKDFQTLLETTMPAGMRRPARLRPYWPARRERADKAASATVETLLNMDPVRREALLLHRIEKADLRADQRAIVGVTTRGDLTNR